MSWKGPPENQTKGRAKNSEIDAAVTPLVASILEVFTQDGQMIRPSFVYEALHRAGILKHIRPIMARSSYKHDRTPEDEHDIVRNALFLKAQGGDVLAAKQWAEMSEEPEAQAAFNVNINITPYTIKDPTLALIAAKSDTPFVMDILKGISDRMAIDEAPHEMRRMLQDFSVDFKEWAKEAYAPRDESGAKSN